MANKRRGTVHEAPPLRAAVLDLKPHCLKSSTVKNGYSCIKAAITSGGKCTAVEAPVPAGALGWDILQCRVNCSKDWNGNAETTCLPAMCTSGNTHRSSSAVNGKSLSSIYLRGHIVNLLSRPYKLRARQARGNARIVSSVT